jgi:CDP-diacylglycerol--glycerol-3-phosphate 3-phosphatidyltransferase
MIIVPVALTLSRIVLIPFVVYYLFIAPDYFLGSFLYTVALITDMCDGMAARYFLVVSEWGKFWDPLADKLFLWSFFAGAAYAGLLSWWIVFIFIVRDLLVTFARMYALKTGRAFVTSQLAKYKTVFQALLGYVIIAIPLGIVSQLVVNSTIFVAVALSCFSAFQYILTFPQKVR